MKSMFSLKYFDSFECDKKKAKLYLQLMMGLFVSPSLAV